jgi:hypothetical protein
MTSYIPNRNYQKKRLYERPTDTIADPAYKQFARDVADASGNEPGNPNAFKNILRANNATKRVVTPEQILIQTVNNTPIQQIDRNPILTYSSMVEDVPFDKKHFKKVQQNLQVLGYASLLLGGAYSLDMFGL